MHGNNASMPRAVVKFSRYYIPLIDVATFSVLNLFGLLKGPPDQLS